MVNFWYGLSRARAFLFETTYIDNSAYYLSERREFYRRVREVSQAVYWKLCILTFKREKERKREREREGNSV